MPSNTSTRLRPETRLSFLGLMGPLMFYAAARVCVLTTVLDCLNDGSYIVPLRCSYRRGTMEVWLQL
jgi:hypothetical protein